MPQDDPKTASGEEELQQLRSTVRALRQENADLLAELEQRQATWGRYGRLYEHAPIPFLMLDGKGFVHIANRAAASLLGCIQPELIGKPFIVAAPMVDPAPFWRHLQRCAQEQTTTSTEIELALRAGETRIVRIISSPMSDPSRGDVLATALIDLEERVRSEREIKRAHEVERRLRARLEGQVRAGAAIGEAHAEMHVHGVESVLQSIAEQARHLVDAEMCALGIGGSPESTFDYWMESGVDQSYHARIGRPPRRVGVLELVASGAIVRTKDLTRHPTFRGLPPGHFAMTSFLGVPLKHRDRAVGSLYVANKRTAAEFDEDDERALVLLAEYAALVTEAALATEAEVRERARLRLILDQLPEAVIVMDSSGRFLPNARALELAVDSGGRVDSFGNPAEWDVRHPDGRPVAWPELPLVRAFEQRETLADMELAAVTRDGRLVPVLANATPLVDDKGRSLGAVVVWRDIEQAKRLEQLRQEWAAVVAHDLRQPLMLIKLWDQLLASDKGARTDRERAALTAIEKAVTRMGVMLDDLIDSTLLETHRITLRKTKVVVQDLVSEAVAALTDGTVRLELEAGAPAVDADHGRIERVLDNLISNAIKYGTPGTEIVIAVRRRQQAVEVAVTNEGETLTADELEKLFSRFYRARSAQPERGIGLGLGLYIARGFVEAHGGRLWCESGEGRTTFLFTLPCAEATGAEREERPPA